MPDHYRTLGVHPSASVGQIRAAYRDLARRLHPDHHRDASAPEASHAERRMREINEAWRVLQDPIRRGRYDADRLGHPEPTPRNRAAPSARTDEADDDLVDVGPSGLTARAMYGLPWILLIVALGFIFVMTAYAGKGTDPPAVAPGDAPVGTCLVVTAGPSTSVVPCDRPNNGKVVARVDDMAACPEGSDPRRLTSAGQIDCLSPP